MEFQINVWDSYDIAVRFVRFLAANKKRALLNRPAKGRAGPQEVDPRVAIFYSDSIVAIQINSENGALFVRTAHPYNEFHLSTLPGRTFVRFKSIPSRDAARSNFLSRAKTDCEERRSVHLVLIKTISLSDCVFHIFLLLSRYCMK